MQRGRQKSRKIKSDIVLLIVKCSNINESIYFKGSDFNHQCHPLPINDIIPKNNLTFPPICNKLVKLIFSFMPICSNERLTNKFCYVTSHAIPQLSKACFCHALKQFVKVTVNDFLFHPCATVIVIIEGLVVIVWETVIDVDAHLWPLLLTWFNFNPSMDK